MKATLNIIGYWQSPEQSHFPDPSNMIDESWDIDEKQIVLDYLSQGQMFVAYRGFSWCRFNCGQSMGSLEYTDGKYVWPQDFAHYLQVHGVKPPQEFIDHCKSAPLQQFDAGDSPEVEYEWWLSATKNARNTGKIIKYSPLLEGSFRLQFNDSTDLDKGIQFLRNFPKYKHEKRQAIIKAIEKSNAAIEIVGQHANMAALQAQAKEAGLTIIFSPLYE